MVDFFRGRKWDLVGLRNLWFAISLLIIIPGLFFWATQGLNYGIDFTGGGLVTYQFAEPVRAGQETAALARVRGAVDKAGVQGQIQLAGTAARTDQLLVRTRVEPKAGQDADSVLSQQRASMRPALEAAFPGITEVAGEMVSPVVSEELIKNAIWSVVAGCVFILFWIRLRYLTFQWSGTALIALVHDVFVLIGVFAMTRKEVNSPFVAAALTVVGYSVHDTIVIFDRIRENLRLRKGNTFAETANISLLETMPRSVNTVLTTELVLVSLFLFGGVSLRDFAFAMMVGITVGAYSSIFNAAQLLVVLKNREGRKMALKRAPGRPMREVAGRAPVRQPRSLKPVAQAPAQAPSAASEEAEDEEEEAEAAVVQERDAPPGPRRKLKAGRKRKRRF